MILFIVDDFDKLSNQKDNNSTSKISSIFKGTNFIYINFFLNKALIYSKIFLVGSKKLSKIFKRNPKNGK